MRNVVFLLAIVLFSACAGHEAEPLVSTIDSTMQEKVSSVLDSALSVYGAQSGQVVVMEVQTGRVLALVGDSLTVSHESGMVSPVILLGSLETEKVKLSDMVDAGNGIFVLGHDTLRDPNWRKGGYGVLPVRDAFAKNSSIAAYKTVIRAWDGNLQEAPRQLRAMGYGKPDSIKGLGAVAPVVITSQEASARVSPMQNLAFMNAIANRGQMVVPFVYEDSTQVLRQQVVSAPTVDSLRTFMRYYVTKGLGKPAASQKVETAGYAAMQKQPDGTYWMEFFGYFPADNPRYSVMVTLSKESLPGSVAALTGAVFKEIAETLSEE